MTKPHFCLSRQRCRPDQRDVLRVFGAAILLCIVITGCSYSEYQTPSGRLDRALGRLAAAGNEEGRFYALDDAAKESFVVGHIKNADQYAKELLTLAPRHTRNWNYGNAIQDGNLVLGRIAVREGHIDEAKRFLEEAGKSPGSPQMDSFGPNLSLAKDLLEKGETQAVLNYFEACRKFWEHHQDRLDQWADDVKAGRTPDFGANLLY